MYCDMHAATERERETEIQRQRDRERERRHWGNQGKLKAEADRYIYCISNLKAMKLLKTIKD